MAYGLISAALEIIHDNKNKPAQICSPRQQLSLLFTNIPAQIWFGCCGRFLFLWVRRKRAEYEKGWVYLGHRTPLWNSFMKPLVSSYAGGYLLVKHPDLKDSHWCREHGVCGLAASLTDNFPMFKKQKGAVLSLESVKYLSILPLVLLSLFCGNGDLPISRSFVPE